MSHVEAGIYRGPRPDCIYCKGTGIRKIRRAHEEGWDVVSERCACTDPRPQNRAQAGRTPQGSEGKQGAERLRRKKTREREKRMSETRKDNRTQEWAERVGREAVELEMPKMLGLAWMGSSGGGRLHPCDMPADDEVWPDFRDCLTELACIKWVEDVAREVGEDFFSVLFGDSPAVVFTRMADGPRFYEDVHEAPTLAEACIAAVRAMKGANQ